MAAEQQWVPLKEAAKLLKVSRYKLNQLIDRGLIETRENIKDNREKLVNVTQARQVLATGV
jgi:DNA-binding MarR family transcriptional regulator